jgi:hypothetical protein
METVCSYVLPLRSVARADTPEFSRYLRAISVYCELIIVDGSPAEVFEQHHASWASISTHIRPVSPTQMGKVGGVMTGVTLASHDKVVIADDDVRYGPELLELIRRLDFADVIRPQNYFSPLPWHAAWDSGRIMLNRIFGGDWPGTLAIRSHALLDAGGYSGDVMFENYELVKTISRAGGRHELALDIFVRRLPPTSAHFVSQRVRQAYDELARPLRLVPFLLIGPLTLRAILLRRWGRLFGTAALVSLGTVGVAECGRRRCGAQDYFPLQCSLMAPLWVAERAICGWAAVLARIQGGIPYGDGRIKMAATKPPRAAWDFLDLSGNQLPPDRPPRR